jgi:hypothetical protein
MQLTAQSDSIRKLTYSAYGELYYSYDFTNPPKHKKSDFLYNHKRHNELNVNLLLAKVNYNSKKYRANLGIMAGNYAQYNLSAEPKWAQFVYEANFGIKISDKHNLWLDAGIMPSHIGFESAISADCWTLTRSLLAENSPYYETGLKLNRLSKNEKLSVSLLLLNGWQKIRRPDFIRKPSFGIQVNYKPTEKLALNYSNFTGTDKPDSLHATRLFHNIYLQYEMTKSFGILAGLDIGAEKLNSSKYGLWYSPVFIIRKTINKKSKIALRAEYYHDKNQIIIVTNTINGFQTFGFSFNFDYAVNRKMQFRVEGKNYQSKDNIFHNNRKENYALTANLTIKL